MSGNVIPLHPQRTSEWLEALARRPWAYNRPLLLDLAERFRAIEAIEIGSGDQLEIEEAA
jgi:hypothetical protein